MGKAAVEFIASPITDQSKDVNNGKGKPLFSLFQWTCDVADQWMTCDGLALEPVTDLDRDPTMFVLFLVDLTDNNTTLRAARRGQTIFFL